MIYGVGTGRFGNAVAAASIVRFPAVSQLVKPVVVASVVTGCCCCCCSVVIGKLLLFEVMIGGGGGGGGGRKHSNPGTSGFSMIFALDIFFNLNTVIFSIIVRGILTVRGNYGTIRLFSFDLHSRISFLPIVLHFARFVGIWYHYDL